MNILPEPRLAAEMAQREHAALLLQAEQAGKGLGEFDKAEEKFDDTPPSSIGPELAEAYQSAYRRANPGFAL